MVISGNHKVASDEETLTINDLNLDDNTTVYDTLDESGTTADEMYDETEQDDYASVSLTSLTPSYSGDYEGHYGERKAGVALSDKFGNEYDDCIEYKWGFAVDYDGDAIRGDVYDLDYAYSSFTGTIFVPDERSAGYDDWFKDSMYYLEIYGDGEILFTSPQMISTQEPVDFDLDVSGINQLSIKWIGGAYSWNTPIGLANAFLIKNKP